MIDLFKEEYPNIKIGVCRYHENFMLLLDELHKVNKTIPTYLKEFGQSLVCNPEIKL